MISRVASKANAVVPVVSFKEMPKEDWRQLPRLISAGFATTSLVICTHFDQVRAVLYLTTTFFMTIWQISGNREMEQRSIVARVFFGSSDVQHVIPCSSNMGLSATALLRGSATGWPSFQSIWDPRNVEHLVSMFDPL